MTRTLIRFLMSDSSSFLSIPGRLTPKLISLSGKKIWSIWVATTSAGEKAPSASATMPPAKRSWLRRRGRRVGRCGAEDCVRRRGRLDIEDQRILRLELQSTRALVGPARSEEHTAELQ